MAMINPAALLAALEANHAHKADPGRKGCGIEKAIRAYLAASPLAAPAGVTVKPLEWRKAGDFLLRADTGLGFSYFANTRTRMWIGFDDDWAVSDDPVAASQADFNARIMLVVEPSTAAADIARHYGGECNMLQNDNVDREDNIIRRDAAYIIEERIRTFLSTLPASTTPKTLTPL